MHHAYNVTSPHAASIIVLIVYGTGEKAGVLLILRLSRKVKKKVAKVQAMTTTHWTTIN